jgi:hypothetical protein
MIPALGLLACVGGSTAAPVPNPVAAPTPVDAPASVPAVAPVAGSNPTSGVVELPFDATGLPVSLAIDVVDGRRFRDANGVNVFVMARSESADLTATHAIVEGNRVVATKRRVVQPRPPCDVDYPAEFVDGATSITDLDDDGLAEITFAYKYACVGDISPREYKLLVLEDGVKAILRGAEVVTWRDGSGKPMRIGEGTFAPEGFEDHPRWLEHAKTVWRAHVEHRLGQ